MCRDGRVVEIIAKAEEKCAVLCPGVKKKNRNTIRQENTVTRSRASVQSLTTNIEFSSSDGEIRKKNRDDAEYMSAELNQKSRTGCEK